MRRVLQGRTECKDLTPIVRALSLALVALAASAIVVAAPFQEAGAPRSTTGVANDDPAAALFTRMCVKCHEPARITALRRTRTEWDDVLNKMVERGATGTDEEFEKVYEYLLRHHGKLNINVATPEDISLIVGLAEKDAQAIAAYRKANGSFADLDAVKKVPGVDIKKLDARKDAIVF